MNAQVKQLWIEALMSSIYKQGREQLRTEKNTFCCLGVLCDLHAQRTGNGRWAEGCYYAEDFYNAHIPPSPVLEWAELDATLCRELVDLNDITKYSFSEIADWIEHHLL